MIRQAHTYLVGALSGVVVIGIAIAAFVVLVSAQVFHELPLPALSSSDQTAAAVSTNKAVTAPDGGVVASSTGGVGTPRTTPGNANPGPSGGPQGTDANGAPAGGAERRDSANAATPTRDATGPAEAVETAPSATNGGDRGSSEVGGKTSSPKHTQPSSNPQSPSSSNSGSSGGGNPPASTGTSGSNGGATSTPPSSSGSSGGAPTTGTGGSTTTSPPATPVTTAKPSETITETVNGTVGAVDEATGGTLSETGVTKVTEEVVNGVAGPESVVGKSVDGVGEAVGGLVGGSGQ